MRDGTEAWDEAKGQPLATARAAVDRYLDSGLPAVVSTSMLAGVLGHHDDVIDRLARLHPRRGKHCDECGEGWPCTTRWLIGRASDDE